MYLVFNANRNIFIYSSALINKKDFLCNVLVDNAAEIKEGSKYNIILLFATM